MSEPPSSWRRQTIAVAAGRERSPGAPLNVPPTFAATYRDGGEIGYGRFDNPTWAAFERTIGALEGGHAVSFASGQAASTAVLTPLAQGATVVLPQDAYTGTRALMSELEQRGALSLRPVDVTDTEAVLAALDGARLLWLESPTNPMLGIAELPRLLEAARSARVFSVVDNTFATPVLQQPLALGADAVLHSATKYLGGHSDLVMGVVVTANPQRREVLVEHRTMRGSVPGVMEAYLALRGLRTLAVRVREQSAAALELATRLNGDPRIHAVHYPGLASDPGHERASAQMTAFGGMVSFELRDGDAADRLVGALRLIVGGTSLGGVESTIDRRRRWPGEERVPAGLLRLSVGLEHVEDLWEDLDQALTGSAFAP
ncbi:MAG TPA: PLP-dependent aspartate aminotransferase family protein [Solirubrobacteraceae bacterium]|nr:PLP-dependent aspartate aminotransferase family protein [Solirubrobacteraceae bacterium]